MEWKELLDKISFVVNTRIKSNYNYYDKDEITNNWLGYPPCSIEAISKKESELGIKLPASYKEFLLLSNGFKRVSLFAGHLLPVEEIGYFKDLEKISYGLFEKEKDNSKISDEDYFNYENQDSENFRVEYLLESIVISKNVEGVLFLLNPKVQFGEESEAWAFGSSLPSAHRYQSFKEMIVDEINTTIELLDED